MWTQKRESPLYIVIDINNEIPHFTFLNTYILVNNKKKISHIIRSTKY